MRHERSDHIDELCQAGDVHAIGVPQQRVEEPADQQRVLEVVDLFEQLRRDGATAVGGLPVTRPIPDVPLVERQPQPLARFVEALHVVADRGDLVNVAIHVEVHRQVARGAVPGDRWRVAVVGVE